MSKIPVRETAYAQYVNTNVVSILAAGEGLYNYKELAEKVGLKPTQHFRRRINWMAASGKLTVVPTFTPRGGIENRFTLPPIETSIEAPAW